MSLDPGLTIPPLVIIGDRHLMSRQLEVPLSELQSTQFQASLLVLKAAMTHYQGIGIAAPQIGWNARVFCLGTEADSERYPMAPDIPFGFWINPQIIASSEALVWAWEGCLSVPGLRGWVQRPEQITVAGIDELGRTQEQTLGGFAARVWQHEFDHLDGVLYPSRVSHPRWLLPDACLAQQADWPEKWPSPGAATTPSGQLSSCA